MTIKSKDVAPRSGGMGVARRGTAENSTKPVVTVSGKGDVAPREGSYGKEKGRTMENKVTPATTVRAAGEKNKGSMQGCIDKALDSGKTDM